MAVERLLKGTIWDLKVYDMTYQPVRNVNMLQTP